MCTKLCFTNKLKFSSYKCASSVFCVLYEQKKNFWNFIKRARVWEHLQCPIIIVKIIVIWELLYVIRTRSLKCEKTAVKCSCRVSKDSNISPMTSPLHCIKLILFHDNSNGNLDYEYFNNKSKKMLVQLVWMNQLCSHKIETHNWAAVNARWILSRFHFSLILCLWTFNQKLSYEFFFLYLQLFIVCIFLQSLLSFVSHESP